MEKESRQRKNDNKKKHKKKRHETSSSSESESSSDSSSVVSSSSKEESNSAEISVSMWSLSLLFFILFPLILLFPVHEFSHRHAIQKSQKLSSSFCLSFPIGEIVVHELHDGHEISKPVVLDVWYGLEALVESDLAYLDGFLHHVHDFVVKYAEVQADCQLQGISFHGFFHLRLVYCF